MAHVSALATCLRVNEAIVDAALNIGVRIPCARRVGLAVGLVSVLAHWTRARGVTGVVNAVVRGAAGLVAAVGFAATLGAHTNRFGVVEVRRAFDGTVLQFAVGTFKASADQRLRYVLAVQVEASTSSAGRRCGSVVVAMGVGHANAFGETIARLRLVRPQAVVG